MLDSEFMNLRMPNLFLRQKIDLTKYIEEHSFTFDNVFESNQDNGELYEECVKPLVSETFGGAKTTCFAYG